MWPLGAAKMRLVQLADHAVPAFDNTLPFDPSTLPSVLLSTAHAGTSTSTHPAAAAECRKRHRASQLAPVRVVRWASIRWLACNATVRASEELRPSSAVDLICTVVGSTDYRSMFIRQLRT